MILVDASVLIDYLRGRPGPAVERFAEVLDRGLPWGLSSFTLLEVLQGAATKDDFDALREYLSSQTIYALKGGSDSYAAAARIFFDLRRKGKAPRSSIDCLIAQTAIEHDLHLLHSDADFDRVAEAAPLKIW